MKTIYKVLIGLAFFISTSQANADPFGAFGGSGATDVDTFDLTSITLDVLETGTITDLNLYIPVVTHPA